MKINSCHEISHPWNLPPRFTIRCPSVYSKRTTLKEEEQLRCESLWGGRSVREWWCVGDLFLPCSLSAVDHFGLWWWMGEATAEPWHSPDVSFQPLRAGIICVRSNTAESDGWPPPQPHAAGASTLFHWSRFIQNRAHIMAQIYLLVKFFFLSISSQLALVGPLYISSPRSFLLWFVFYLHHVS